MRRTKAQGRVVLPRGVTWTPVNDGRANGAPRSPLWPLAAPWTERWLPALRAGGAIALIALAYVIAVFGTSFFVFLSSP